MNNQNVALSSIDLPSFPYCKTASKNHKNVGIVKHHQKVSVNPDYSVVPDTTELPQFEYAKGNSWVRISNDNVQPFTTETPRVVSIRGKIKGYSKKSRQRFMSKVSKIDQNKVDPNYVLFITLTAPAPEYADGAGWREISGKEWKRNRLNNFLTQLRQNHTGSTFCGFWRQEFQERGAVHYHLITYNTFICKDWVAQRWNAICRKGLSAEEQQKHLQAGTQVQPAKSWVAINNYCSKTMAYVTKDESWKIRKDFGEPMLKNGKRNPKYDPDYIKWMESHGRAWGVINQKNLDALCDVDVQKFSSTKHYNKAKRIMHKYVASCIKRKFVNMHKKTNPNYKEGVGNYNHKIGRKLDKLYRSKRYGKFQAFIPEKEWLRILECVGEDISKLVDPKSNTGKDLKGRDKFINVNRPVNDQYRKVA